MRPTLKSLPTQSFRSKPLSNFLKNRRVTVVGAGIAGLTAATALAQRGAEVTVLERAEALREVGAGIQVSPNAGRVLAQLGLAEALDAVSVRSDTVTLRDSSGRQIALLDFAQHRPDDDFLLVHRARMLSVLETGARAAGVEICLNADVTEPPEGELVVAADGVKSVLRPILNGNSTASFTGQTAWRAVIPAGPVETGGAEIFMGPGRHLVSYPLGFGQRNIVAVIERKDWQAEGWNHPGDPADLRAAFSRFGPQVTTWLDQVTEVGVWGLFRHPVAGRWHDGRIVLTGDAAHPTLPFIAQGAVMAIEDAWALAACLDAEAEQTAALDRYQALRQPRCIKIVEAANANARNYHLRGPARAIAHAGLRGINRFAPASLIERFAWLYDYDPVAAV